MKKGIKFVAQRKAWDCGVAAMAMLAGKSYGDVAQVLRDSFNPDCQALMKKRGITLVEMRALGGWLGVTLEITPRAAGYLEGQTGILTLRGDRYCKEGHYVVLKDGTHVIDPDGTDVWKLEDYLSRHGVRTATLLAWRKK